MATKQAPKNDSAQTRDIAIDVLANDLVHLGLDSDGQNHYYDSQRDRIVVTGETHDEYTRDESALVRRSLVAGAATVEEVVDDIDGDLKTYLQFVASSQVERSWESITVEFVDTDKLLGSVGGV